MKPFTMTLNASLCEDGSLIQEYDVIDASNAIADCATTLEVDEIILVGNPKYCFKKKNNIEKELKNISTYFNKEFKINVRIEEI